MTASAYTPFEVDNKDRIVGFFVIGAVLLILIGFIIPAIDRFSREEGLHFFTILDQTYGIAVDSSVSLVGVMVGRVTQVGVTDDGVVRVDMVLAPEYQRFYTEGSRLEVDSNIAVSTLLTGSGLLLLPGPEESGYLEIGSHIPVELPKGFGSILEELDAIELAGQVKRIVGNLEALTEGLASNQGKVYASLDHLEQVTANVAGVSERLPELIGSVNRSMGEAETLLQSVGGLVDDTRQQIPPLMDEGIELTRQATRTLAEAEVLMGATVPALTQLPAVMVSTDAALQSVSRLSDQLSRSWLLGGSASGASPGSPVPGFHARRQDPYPNRAALEVCEGACPDDGLK